MTFYPHTAKSKSILAGEPPAMQMLDSEGGYLWQVGLLTNGKFRIESISSPETAQYLEMRENGVVIISVEGATSNRFKLLNTGDLYLGGTLSIEGDSIAIGASKTPASAGAEGVAGQIAWDSSYMYVCVATDTWRRVAHATW